MTERNPRDRDARRAKTPPAGVRAQTAAPEHAESWDDELTPLPIDTHAALARVDSRVKLTNLATMDRVEAVRVELSSSVREIDRRVLDLSGDLARMAEGVAAMTGKLELLVSDRAVDRQEVSVVRVETARAELDVRRTREADAAEARRHARQLVAAVVIKLFAGAGAVWAVASAAIMSGRC